MARLISPTGEIAEVPEDQVQHFLSRGARLDPSASSPGNPLLGQVLSRLPATGAGIGGVLGGVAGAGAGGVGAIPGGLGGAALGGAAGRVVEQVGRRIAGLPQSESEVFGQRVPELLDVPAKAAEQAALEAQGVGVGAAVARPLAAGLGRVGQFFRTRAGNEAVKRLQEARASREVGPEIARSLERQTTARSRLGTETTQALEAAGKQQQQITINNIVDEITKRQKKIFPRAQFTSADRADLVRKVRDRINSVASEFSLGFMSGRQIVFSPGEANVIKRAFQSQSRSGFSQLARGVVPNPDLDRAIAVSFRSNIERVVPNAKDLNRQTQEVIQDIQGLSQMKRAQPSPSVKRIREQAQERFVRTAAEGRQATLPLGIRFTSSGIRPQVFFQPSALITAPAEATARGLRSPLTLAALRQLPRIGQTTKEEQDLLDELTGGTP